MLRLYKPHDEIEAPKKSKNEIRIVQQNRDHFFRLPHVGYDQFAVVTQKMRADHDPKFPRQVLGHVEPITFEEAETLRVYCLTMMATNRLALQAMTQGKLWEIVESYRDRESTKIPGKA